MRVLIAAPPKTGNVWFEKLVSLAFDLKWVRTAPPYDYWATRDAAPLVDFIKDGAYPDGSVFHQHYWPSDQFLRIARDQGIFLVTTLRDPYDQFVSWYFYIQNFAEAFVAARDPGQRAIGKPIDHPDVLDLLANEFGAFLDQGIAWLHSGQSLVVRYEDLQAGAEAALTAAQRYFGVAPAMDLAQAAAGASAAAMRREDAALARHIRTGRSGGWRDALSDVHLDILRRQHAERIARLGYAVRVRRSGLSASETTEN
jgi:hypothetical protein